MTLAAEQREISEQRFVLSDADWNFYQSVLQQVGDQHVFVTFDQGRIELMAPSFHHDQSARLIHRLICTLAEELDLPIVSGGSTTFHRKDLQRGLEPDECYYTANEARIRGKQDIDLAVDPPPDLAVEVEISRRMATRTAIYAALGVPELWRYDGRQLRIYRLSSAGAYARCDASPTFPSVPLKQLERFLAAAQQTDETAWAKSVRAWLREHIVGQ